MPENPAGPDTDTEFFRDLERVFAEHPTAASRYTVRFAKAELALGIDPDQQIGVNRVENGEVIKTFQPLFLTGGEANEDLPAGHGQCCEWQWNPNTLTWKCLTMCPGA
ncbi:hypothetical protein [Streptomyces albogriseolus]|uniref:hypothetical protein n=1 Tax=Streptomyces albogriseolus TaxID=1887 RepID=UPI003F4A26BD